MKFDISRRSFLGGCVALAGCSAWRGAFASASPLMRLGVVSDVHLRNPGDEKEFLAALEYFKHRNVDGVLIAGDIADTGRIYQLKLCADAWYKVFPDGKYPDGRRCEQLFVYGNHCIDAWTWGGELEKDPERAAKEAIGLGDNRSKCWEEFFHEEYNPIWIKKINGCPVVGSHWNAWRNGALAKFIAEHRSELTGDFPFVYTQHAHPKDTCFGKWAWGYDEGDSTAALSEFPNCVAFSGHSHYTLTDERTVWQGAFTSINTSSLKYSSIDYSMRENMPGNGFGYKGEMRGHKMPNMGTYDGRQGMVVSFYEDRLSIERREFVYGKSLGPDWIVPFGAGRVDFSYDLRAARRSAPEFGKGAAVSAFISDEGEKGRSVRVGFPQADSVDGCRPFEYEVTAVLLEDDIDLVLAQRRVMAAGYHLPEELAEGKPNFCVFDPSELVKNGHKGHFRFDVRPVECYGKKGAAISSGVVEIMS